MAKFKQLTKKYWLNYEQTKEEHSSIIMKLLLIYSCGR